MKLLLIVIAIIFSIATLSVALIVSLLSPFLWPLIDDKCDDYYFYPDNEI